MFDLFRRAPDPWPLTPEGVSRALQRVASNRRKRGSYFLAEERGLDLDELLANERSFARTVAQAVREGSYRFEPMRLRSAILRGKRRALDTPGVVDQVVLTALASALQQIIEPRLSAHLYSYRPGRSHGRAVAEFARFVRAADLRGQRGALFVLRRDVRGYFDDIAVTADAPLFRVLAAELETARLGSDAQQTLLSFVQQALRAPVQDPAGQSYCRLRGVGVGTPLAMPLSNLYLRDLDEELAARAGAHYARYGDDVLFVHREEASARWASACIDTWLARRGLSENADKRLDLCLTASGHGVVPGFRAASRVEFLGTSVDGQGQRSLPARRVRAFLRELRARLCVALHGSPRDQLDERAAIACAVVRDALDVHGPARLPAARALRDHVDCRGQLRWVDQNIVRLVAAHVTQVPGARALRIAPPLWLHTRGLASVEFERNARSRMGTSQGAAS